MVQNYIKLAFRSLHKHLEYSIINVSGLAIGFACFIFILLYVLDELSYDTSFKQSDKIYRMVLERSYPTHSIDYALVPHSFNKVLSRDYQEVRKATRLMNFGNEMTMRYEDHYGNLYVYDEDKIFMAD